MPRHVHLFPLPVPKSNLTANDDHVGEVERSICTIKERARATIHGLPYRQIPKLMVKGLVYKSVNDLNQFPTKNGVSDSASPRNIVTGQPNPDFNKLCIEYGAYAQV
jgi:hypothetical protein